MLKQKAICGTLESSDVLIELEPCDTGLTIEVNSVVFNQFGEDIERTVREVLSSFDISTGKVRVNDRGAADCAIRARMETAIKRSRGEI